MIIYLNYLLVSAIEVVKEHIGAAEFILDNDYLK